MPGRKRTSVRIAAALAAAEAARKSGAQVRSSRVRRRLTQRALGELIGVSRALVAAIEAGHGGGSPLAIWFALGEALGRPFRAEYQRDGLEQPIHAAHLDIQELVLRVGRAAGYDGRFELATRPADQARSSDASLLDRRHRRLILVECWNAPADLGAAMRASDRKRAEADGLAITLAGDGPPWTVGLCWVVRDTRANRAMIGRYEHIFASRFRGASAAWTRALTTGAPFPEQPGLLWCDVRATRLFARRGTSRWPVHDPLASARPTG